MDLASRFAAGEAEGQWVTQDVVQGFYESLSGGPAFRGMGEGEMAEALERGLREFVAYGEGG